MTLTVTEDHKVSRKQNLLALFSCMRSNWSGKQLVWTGVEAFQVEYVDTTLE